MTVRKYDILALVCWTGSALLTVTINCPREKPDVCLVVGSNFRLRPKLCAFWNWYVVRPFQHRVAIVATSSLDFCCNYPSQSLLLRNIADERYVFAP
jgi:hypothetical protein